MLAVILLEVASALRAARRAEDRHERRSSTSASWQIEITMIVAAAVIRRRRRLFVREGGELHQLLIGVGRGQASRRTEDACRPVFLLILLQRASPSVVSEARLAKEAAQVFVNGEDDAGGRSRGRCRRRLVDVAFAFTFVRDDHVVDAVFALDGRGEDHSLFHCCFVGVWFLGDVKIICCTL